MHLDIMRSRPEAGAIVHTHASFATALAIAPQGHPRLPLHDRRVGGNDIRCADYATYGTEELSHNALKRWKAAPPACSPITA